MELFKVTCVTCQAKLSVRNAALIGEIVACPKCESMVLVAAPETSGLSPATNLAPVAELPSPVEQPAEIFPDNADFETAATELPPVEIPASGVEADLSVNPISAGNKAILWWVASFAVGASVTGAFLVLRNQGDSPSAVVAESQILDAGEDQSSAELQPLSAVEPANEKELEVIPDRPSRGVSSQDDPLAEPQATRPANASPKKTQPPVESGVDETVTPTVTSEQETPPPKLVVEPPDKTRIARKFDPLRFDLEEMDLTDLGASEEPLEANANQSAPVEDDLSPEKQSPEIPAVVRVSENSPNDFSNRSAEEQLRYMIPSIRVKDMALNDFLIFAGNLSGVPISVAPIELQMAGVSPGKQVSLDAQEIYLDEAITQVLKPLHLEITTIGPQVIIVRGDAQRVRSINYPVDDLIGPQTSAEDFAKWIEVLIGPESWSGAGGIGTISASPNGLQIEQAQGVHFRILFFLERIRLAKQIPLRSRFPARLLGAKPLSMEIADRVAAPTTFTFSHEAPLAEVFRYWQSEMGLPVFVDWPALAKVNLWPESRVTCHITNKPWHAALDAVLTPLELGWRAGPGGAIQISSQDVLNSEPELDIYPVKLWQDNSNDEATVIHDPENDLVYVRAPAAAHRAMLDR